MGIKRMPLSFTWFIVMIAIIVVTLSCARKVTESKPEEQEEIGKSKFDADTAMAFVATQVSFGPRTPGSSAHAQCGEYLYNTLAAYAPKVQKQNFTAKRWDGKEMQGVNIIASFSPEKTDRILLAAHWDTRPYADQEEDVKLHNKAIDGANDGASGVGVLLEVARILYQKQADVGVDIIFFDLEDSGTPSQENYRDGDANTWCKGAQYWAQTPHIQNYRARYGILLDMVGNAGPIFAQEATSVYYAIDVMEKVWDIAEQAGYGNVFVRDQVGGVIDDHLFVNKIAGIPMIDIINRDYTTTSGFFPQWHTMGDNMERIDPKTLAIVGDVVLRTIYKEK